MNTKLASLSALSLLSLSLALLPLQASAGSTNAPTSGLPITGLPTLSTSAVSTTLGPASDECICNCIATYNAVEPNGTKTPGSYNLSITKPPVIDNDYEFSSITDATKCAAKKNQSCKGYYGPYNPKGEQESGSLGNCKLTAVPAQ